MSLYSVLLVDDEEEVCSVIMKKLDWESMGFRIAGYARNGVEALEMAEELQIDVVMTDIKMPYMDGLTLCRKLKEQYRKIKVIIFSGFDDFEYAREAIKIEAEEYILKPINANEIREWAACPFCRRIFLCRSLTGGSREMRLILMREIAGSRLTVRIMWRRCFTSVRRTRRRMR